MSAYYRWLALPAGCVTLAEAHAIIGFQHRERGYNTTPTLSLLKTLRIRFTIHRVLGNVRYLCVKMASQAKSELKIVFGAMTFGKEGTVMMLLGSMDP